MPCMSRNRAGNMPTPNRSKAMAAQAWSRSCATNRGDTFRTVYTVRLAGSVYVLHAFQKKSKTGRETPKSDIDLIDRRFKEAERMAKERQR